MSDPLASVLLDDVSKADALLTLLALSSTGSLLLRPQYAAASPTVVDFTWAYLNPAAQHLLQLPAHPATSLLTSFPTIQATGAFAFYRDAFVTGQLAQCQVPAFPEGQSGYYQLVAQRQGELLAVSLLRTAEPTPAAGPTTPPPAAVQDRTPVAATAIQRDELDRLFAQAPVALALFTGPDYVIARANEPMATVWSRPLAQVLGPALRAQPRLRSHFCGRAGPRHSLRPARSTRHH
jgi:hypothetical protein